MCLANANRLVKCFKKPFALESKFKKQNFDTIVEMTGGCGRGGARWPAVRLSQMHWLHTAFAPLLSMPRCPTCCCRGGSI
jgi:hypothetical protein